MNNINLSHFYSHTLLRIIHTVDEGHHLNVLLNLDTACAPNPHALFFIIKPAREKVLINLPEIKTLLLGHKRTHNMKTCIIKTNILVVLLATSLLTTVAAAAVPKTALIKAEPIDHTHLKSAAHNSLKLTFTSIIMNYTQQPLNNGLAKQKQAANKNKSVTLTRANLISE